MSRKEIILVLILLTCFTFFVQWSGAEQRSFFSLILALNNEHSLRTDRYADLSPDKAFYNGHYYSDKAPGLSFLGLPVFAIVNAMQDLNRPGLLLPYSIYMVSAWVVSLPAVLLALLIVRFVRRLGFSENQAIAAGLAMALGSLAFPFSTLFFSHQPAALFAFAAFFILFRVRQRDVSPRPALFVAGALAGLSVVTEYPLAIMALLLFAYAAFSVPDKRLSLYYVLGGLPLAFLLMAYNHAAFEHPLRFSYFYEQNTWAQVHQTGLLGLGIPRLSTLVDIIAGPRGLIVLSPVLVLAVYGLVAMLRSQQWRAEGIFCLASFSVYLLMTAGYKVPPTNIWVPGPRFLLPAVPFLAAPMAFALARWPRLFALLATLSIGIMFLITAANPQAPPEVANPLFDYWLPGFFDRSQLVHTLPELRFGISRGLSLVPLGGAAALAGLAYALTCVQIARPRLQAAAVSLLIILMALIYLAIAFPIDLRRPFDVPASLTGSTSLTVQSIA